MNKNIIPYNTQSSCKTCDARIFSWFKSAPNNTVIAQRQAQRSSQIILDKQSYLFIEGDIHKTAYTLKEGWAICYKQLANGQRQVLKIALAGDFLGYQTDFDKPIDYSVIAVTDCILCCFNTPAIDKLLSADRSLVQRLMEIQYEQLSACKHNLTVIGQAQTKHKLAYFLIDLVKRLAERKVDIDGVISIPLTREDMADAIGVTPIHLSRVITELSKANILECKNNRLKLIQADLLQMLANGS
jgi:CRP-like cAMP-binding protein